MEDLEYRLQHIFGDIQAVRCEFRRRCWLPLPIVRPTNLVIAAAQKRKHKLGRYSDQARDSCFSAVMCAAQTLLAHSDILNVYLEVREEETKEVDVLRAVAAASSLTGAALSCQVAAAPVSWAATGTFLTTLSWPTVLTLTNPAGLAVGGVGLIIVALSVFKESKRKGDILRYQNSKNLC